MKKIKVSKKDGSKSLKIYKDKKKKLPNVRRVATGKSRKA